MQETTSHLQRQSPERSPLRRRLLRWLPSLMAPLGLARVPFLPTLILNPFPSLIMDPASTPFPLPSIALQTHMKLPAWWCLKVYKKLPALYRKRLQRLVFIHPTFYIKLVCSMLRPFVSRKAHHKVHKVKHLADLEKACGGDISLDVLHLGTHVFKYDEAVATESKVLSFG
eukprot:c21073_g1_i1 orf=136-648(-)